MPMKRLVVILVAVLIAAAVTVWLMTTASPGLAGFALPAFLVAALALYLVRR
ncbi:MAG: hypothetical protein P1U53_13260 [Sulfitobacter sp.]|nr:hypothetical protein [Sulfitobacter sp.]